MTYAPDLAHHDTVDTVDRAAATPDVSLPFAELGLKPDEYQRIVDILGRRPTASELAMDSVMWFFDDLYEQCSDHMTEYIASSLAVGRRPRMSTIRPYSSGLRPSSA